MPFLDEIKENEGFKPHIYKCTQGFDTIGYGFNVAHLTQQELVLNGGKIEPMSKEAAHKILILKLTKLKSEVYETFPWLENEPLKARECVLEMCYQMGISKVKKFVTTLHYIKTRDYKRAYENGLKSLWASQTPNRAKKVLGKLLQIKDA